MSLLIYIYIYIILSGGEDGAAAANEETIFLVTTLPIESEFEIYINIINMAFTLWTLLEATLLCLNAVCVLHEERFLVKSK